MNWIRNAILRWARNRTPDFLIGGQERPYLRRHWLIPRNRFFNIYVHEFLRSDDDRALHDHPWLFNVSWLMEGAYREHTACKHGCHQFVCLLSQGVWKFRWGPAPHRVELLKDTYEPQSGMWWERPCWTLFITGPVVREWGFHCPQRWVPWREFVDQRDAGSIGRGCD